MGMPGDIRIDRYNYSIGTVFAVVVLLAIYGVAAPPLAWIVLPGLVISWGIFSLLHFREVDIAASARIMPVFYIAVAMQLLHFAEEYVTGYPEHMPGLYSGAPWPLDMFVAANMASAALFATACLAVFLTRATWMLVPMLYFVVQGVVGNAIAHTWWSITTGGYFPGLVTSLSFWVLGPLLIMAFTGTLARAVMLMLVIAAATVTGQSMTGPDYPSSLLFTSLWN